jgi:hypothetical protein
MQYCAVEAAIGKGQALGIALNRQKVGRAHPRQGSAKHGAIEIKADIVVLLRQVGQIKPSADSGQ